MKMEAIEFGDTFVSKALPDDVSTNVLLKWLANSSFITTSVYMDFMGKDTLDFMRGMK